MAHSAPNEQSSLSRSAWLYDEVNNNIDDRELSSKPACSVLDNNSLLTPDEGGAIFEADDTNAETKKQCARTSWWSRTKLHRRLQGWRFGVAVSAIMTSGVLLINTTLTCRRKLGWALLALSSIPIHFLYNSAVFKELERIEGVTLIQATAGIIRPETIDFGVFPKQIPTALNDTKLMDIGAQSYLNWYNGPTTSQLRDLYLSNPENFDRLEPEQCVDLYRGALITGHSHAFAIVDPKIEVNISYRSRLSEVPLFRSWTVLGLSEDEADATPLHWPSHREAFLYEVQRDSYSRAWLLEEMYLEYCLAKKEEPHCKLQFSMNILVVIIICNFMKVFVMFWHLWYQSSETFVTFGDALASWLDDADESTKGNCLVESKHVRVKKAEGHAERLASQTPKGVLIRRRQATPSLLEGTARKAPGRRRWAAAVDKMQWLLSLTLCLASLGTAAIFLIMGNSDGDLLGIKQAISAGKFFIEDTTSTLTTGLPTEGAKGLIASVLLVNTPQIILSCCYLAYNGLFTGMHLAYEYSNYAVERKSLRVTEPRGEQRSTYWLQLPYKYSVPLLIATAVMHWLISQSLFLVRVALYTADLAKNTLEADTDSTANKSGVGASLMPILVGVVLASCMLLAVIGLGFRKLASNMPIAGSCSFALAAATHGPEEDEKASKLLLMWGEIPRMGTGELGHCAFTSEAVVELKPKRKYAGRRQELSADFSSTATTK
ncbi:hypothetical protein BST61_g2629 [Cercospora zeina]